MTYAMHDSIDRQPTSDEIAALIAQHRPGHALERPFYTDPAVFARDIENTFLRDWLYVGHVSQIPEPGDYLLFDIAGESVIVLRDNDGGVRALVNVCRHRGSRLCSERRGNTRWLICPYHGWTYDLDGSLQTARLMPRDFDKSAHGLKTVHTRVFHGMILVSFADPPMDFDTAEATLGPLLAPYDIARTKVAHAGLYPVSANWKLAVENYIECYHCAPSHPEFSLSHSIKAPRARSAKLQAEMVARSARVGLSAETIDRTEPSGLQYYYDRYALYEGYLTGSENGEPVAPLLGNIADFDGGASNLQLGMASYFLIYSDHMVVYRFTPRDVQNTDVEVVWLVREDAVEGVDYDLRRLCWLWDVTTVADKRIIEHNQLGVNSRYYTPGPYAPMESACRVFVDWYLRAIG